MKILCIDFDKTLNSYTSGFHEGEIHDLPISGAIESVKELQTRYKIVVLTARKNRRPVRQWLKKYGLSCKVTNVKPRAIAYVDDRAIEFKNNWPEIVSNLR